MNICDMSIWKYELDDITLEVVRRVTEKLDRFDAFLQQRIVLRACLEMEYIAQTLSIAGFIAPAVMASELLSATRCLEQHPASLPAVQKEARLLLAYCEDTVNSGAVQPSLFLYASALRMSNITAQIPAACHMLFIPFTFWNTEAFPEQSYLDEIIHTHRAIYQQGTHAYLQAGDVEKLAPVLFFFRNFSNLELQGRMRFFSYLFDVLIDALAHGTDIMPEDAETLFLKIEEAFFHHGLKRPDLPDQEMVVRILHLIAIASPATAVIACAQEQMKLNALLSGVAPASSLLAIQQPSYESRQAYWRVPVCCHLPWDSFSWQK